MRPSVCSDGSNDPSTSRSQPRAPQAVQNNSNSRHSGGNVFVLLARREISPRTKHSSKKFLGEKSKCRLDSLGLKCEAARDSRRGLLSWVEAESLWHLSDKYCPLFPPPKSTIAAAFSPDGQTLASTHGDHTVKIIDCQTGRCLKVLSGHQRTPWVVRFHPLYPEIIASGSLDHEVRLWDAKTADCIGSRDFYRPISSIAFHAQGELLAVASRHKLFIWHYRRGETSLPTMVLKTRRSLRAVHFHPHGAPFLLTAEVNDLDSSDSPMTLASCPGYLCYPPPTIYVLDAHSAQRADPSASVPLFTYSTPSGQYELLLSPVEPNGCPVPEEPQTCSPLREMEIAIPMETEVQPEERSNQFLPLGDPACWEQPFLQGWLIGQSQAGQHTICPRNNGDYDDSSAYSDIQHPVVVPTSVGQPVITERSGLWHRFSRSHVRLTTGSGEDTSLSNARDEGRPQHSVSRIHSELAISLAAAAAAELPCTVKLRIWPHDVKDPGAYLNADGCRLTIPHAVLCSEMGTHFSPCGRFLAACVACVLPHPEADSGIHAHVLHDVIGISTSPTRHPISAHQMIYELRIYSLEEVTFGSVLASRAIRAVHCLTSIQFSPTSEHLLLAYGRHHSSLLQSVVIEGETTIHIYTILEVYRVSDMELVKVLHSADDEVNVACFHPLVGGGLVYGTQEGKLRIIQYDNSHGLDYVASSFLEENMLEV